MLLRVQAVAYNVITTQKTVTHGLNRRFIFTPYYRVWRDRCAGNVDEEDEKGTQSSDSESSDSESGEESGPSARKKSPRYSRCNGALQALVEDSDSESDVPVGKRCYRDHYDNQDRFLHFPSHEMEDGDECKEHDDPNLGAHNDRKISDENDYFRVAEMDESAENLVFTILYKMAKGERTRAEKISKPHLRLVVSKLEDTVEEGYYFGLDRELCEQLHGYLRPCYDEIFPASTTFLGAYFLRAPSN